MAFRWVEMKAVRLIQSLNSLHSRLKNRFRRVLRWRLVLPGKVKFPVFCCRFLLEVARKNVQVVVRTVVASDQLLPLLGS